MYSDNANTCSYGIVQLPRSRWNLNFPVFFFHLKNTSVLAMLALFLIMWQHYQNTCKNKIKWRENLNFICNMAAAQFHKKRCQYCHKTLVFFSMWKKNCGKIKILSATRQLSYFIRTCASIVKPLVIFWVEAKLRIFLISLFLHLSTFFSKSAQTCRYLRSLTVLMMWGGVSEGSRLLPSSISPPSGRPLWEQLFISYR